MVVNLSFSANYVKGHFVNFVQGNQHGIITKHLNAQISILKFFEAGVVVASYTLYYILFEFDI